MPLLEVQDISFRYGKETILSNWNHVFERGESTAITGPSGRGKSTLLYILGLMLRPSNGSVLVDGQALENLSDASRARFRSTRYGFVFQDAVLDTTRTVLDNVTEVALYNSTSRSQAAIRARELLDQFGVQARATHRPGQLSGGQAQRIALCRALINHPDILLADEPTGNLDPDSAKTVIDALTAHSKQGAGAVVVVVTHDPLVAASCDRRVQL